MTSNRGILVWIGIAAAALAAWAYWPSLERILEHWVSNPDYTHGFLVVPICLWILWARRGRVPSASVGLHWGGLLAIAMAGGVRFLAGRLYLPELDAWSIPLWLGGIVWLVFGWRLLRWALPSLVFLWFATPLPGTIEIFLSTPLQKFAASLSTTVLQVLGQPALAEGTIILLDDHVLDVERACSGLRMFYGVFALAFACVVIIRPSIWKAVAILLSAAPIAIITNVARITATGLLLRFVSGAAAQKFSHDFAGLVMIPLAVLLFIAFYLLLNKLSVRYATDAVGANAWLARWAVGGGALVVALFLWARFQQERALNTLVETANRLEQEEDLWGAIDYLGRYITAHEDDADARAKLAELYGKTATSRGDKLRASHAARIAWERLPDRFDLGLQAAQMAYDAEEHRAAIDLCDRLADSAAEYPVKAEAIKLRADVLTALLASGNSAGDYTWHSAFEALNAAVRLQDFDVRHAAARAEIYRERLREPPAAERQGQADAWMDELVEQRGDSAAAWLARYQYRRHFPDYGDGAALDSVDDDLSRALEIARQRQGDETLDVLLTAAARRQELKNSDEAVTLLREAIDVAPQDFRPYAALASVQRQEGTSESRAEAVATLRQGVSACGNGHLPLVLPLALLLAESGDFAGAEAQIALIERFLPRLVGSERGALRLEAGLVRAQIVTSRDGPLAGISWLRQLLNDPDVRLAQRLRPTSLARAWLMLGHLYLAIDAPDQAVEAFEYCGRIDPANVAWRHPSALAALKAGDLNTAERLFQSIASSESEQPEAWLALTQIEAARQSQQSASLQNWQRFDERLSQSEESGASKASLILLVAQKQLARGNTAEAEDLLESATTEAPDEAALWQGLALVRDVARDPAGALSAAERYAELTQNAIDSIVLQSALLVKQHRANDARLLLESALEKAQAAERPHVAEALARHYLQQGNQAAAVRVLEDAHQAAPKNLQIIDTLANLAFLMNDWGAHEKYEHWLRSAAGDSGSLWRAHRAQRLLLNAHSRDDSAFEEAVGIAQTLYQERPYWWKSYYLQGEIALRTQSDAAAAAAYERAWQYGGRNIVLADRLIDLMTRMGHFEDAQRFVGQIGDFLDRSPQLFDRAMPFLVRGDGNNKAIRIAEQWVQLNPRDVQAQLRLGRVLMLVAQGGDEGERSERMRQAERHFQRAIELAPADVRPWVAAVVFYGQSTGSREKALEVLRRFSDQVDINKIKRSFVLAQLFEGLGMPAEAQLKYLESASLASEEVDPQLAEEVLARAALFYLERSPALAERFARQAINANRSSRGARQVLVQVLARRDGAAALEEAFTVLADLQGDDPTSTRTAYQRRLLAGLLARRKDPGDLQRAIDLLNEILDKSPDDKLRLARLYEENGRLAPAFELLDGLARAPSPRPLDLAEFLRFWQGNFVAKETAEGNGDRFVARARQVYRTLGGMPGQRAERLRWELRELKVRAGVKPLNADSATSVISSLLDELRTINSVEQRQQLLRQSLTVLISENASEAALRLADDPPDWIDQRDAIIQLCLAMIVARPESGSRAAAERLFSKAVVAMKDDADVLSAIGDYRYMFEDYSGAANAYRQAIAVDPSRTVILNNLALALVEQPGKAGAATQTLEKALALDPGSIVLLDTKAVLELIENRPEEALKTLESIADQSTMDPAFQLHRAIAHDMLGESTQAQHSYFQAVGLGVERQLLSPRDRDYLEKLRAKRLTSVAQNVTGLEHFSPNRH